MSTDFESRSSSSLRFAVSSPLGRERAALDREVFLELEVLHERVQVLAVDLAGLDSAISGLTVPSVQISRIRRS
jgi:hypothetical protein